MSGAAKELSPRRRPKPRRLGSTAIVRTRRKCQVRLGVPPRVALKFPRAHILLGPRGTGKRAPEFPTVGVAGSRHVERPEHLKVSRERAVRKRAGSRAALGGNGLRARLGPDSTRAKEGFLWA